MLRPFISPKLFQAAAGPTLFGTMDKKSNSAVKSNFSFPSSRHCPNVSTTPITAMGCRHCLPLSVVQLKGKHCRKPHCRNGVVDTFGPYLYFGPIEGQGFRLPHALVVVVGGAFRRLCVCVFCAITRHLKQSPPSSLPCL